MGSAIALPQLKHNATWYGQTDLHQPFQLGMEEGSWIASIFGLGAIFGGFAAAYLGSKYGQRKALIMLAVPDMVAWVLIASAQNMPMMLIGRFLSGFSAAGYSLPFRFMSRKLLNHNIEAGLEALLLQQWPWVPCSPTVWAR